MAQQQVFPTKGNLMASKRSLAQAQLGYELMDRKRNILIREMVSLSDRAKEIRSSIDSVFADAYKSLEMANIMLGVITPLTRQIPEDNSVKVTYRSVMGVELPTVTIDDPKPDMPYSPMLTNSRFDYAYICFNKAKAMAATLAEIENSIYRLSVAIKKTQKRANALKNILIPRYSEQVKFISNALEEKEREEFSRQKIIKANKEKANKP